MHSSTFSSDEEVALPARVPTRLLLAAVALAGVLLAVLEVGWRHAGFRAMPRDTLQLWALERSRVDGTRHVAAIVGSSRAQLGLDPRVIADELHLPTHQLAITGGSPLPVLQDLANDDEFRGLVICEVTPSAFFLRPADIAKQSGADWVAGWRGLPFVSSIETRLRVALQTKLALLLAQTNVRYQVSSLLTEHALARPAVVRERADRYRAADYSHENLPKTIAHWAKGLRAITPPSPAELGELESVIAGWVAKIRARGGEVVFIRPPSDGPFLEREKRNAPRVKTWDRLLRETGAFGIHYEDYATMRGLEVPEWSHLSRRDAARFTRAYVEVLGERDVRLRTPPVAEPAG